MHRRRFLATAGAVSASGLAGCLGVFGGGATESGDGTPLDEHAAGRDLDAQPVLGSLEGNVIIAFEDPSCARCRAFDQEVLPKIESKLVENGHASYVARNYPVVYPWGKPATQALEATFDRDAKAFWALSSHYFDNQSDFDEDNVLQQTATFLNDETDVDSDAVASDAEAKTFDDQVQADINAAENAGADGVTPSIFIFRDGKYTTKAAGSVSYEVIATALGVE